MKAKKFDQGSDASEAVTGHLDVAKARRVGITPKRVNEDLPSWMVQSIDRAANRLGVTRQSLIKCGWLTDWGKRRLPPPVDRAVKPPQRVRSRHSRNLHDLDATVSGSNGAITLYTGHVVFDF